MRHRIKVAMACFLAVIYATSSICMGADNESPAEVAARQEAQWHWERMKEAIQRHPLPAPESTNEARDHWAQALLQETGSAFWRLCREPMLQTKVEYFVNRFGREGTEPDLAWILSSPQITLVSFMEPARISMIPEDRREEPGLRPVRMALEAERRAQLAIAELQVRRLLADRELLERYCHAVAWSRLVLTEEVWPTRDFDRMRLYTGTKWDDAPEEEYWWYARRFIFLAYVTSRLDLLDGVAAEGLKEKRDEWNAWAMDAGRAAQLVAHPAEPRWVMDPDHHNRGELPPLVLPRRPFPDSPASHERKPDFLNEMEALIRALDYDVVYRDVVEAGFVLELHRTMQEE